jgi:hypothetical protein
MVQNMDEDKLDNEDYLEDESYDEQSEDVYDFIGEILDYANQTCPSIFNYYMMNKNEESDNEMSDLLIDLYNKVFKDEDSCNKLDYKSYQEYLKDFASAVCVVLNYRYGREKEALAKLNEIKCSAIRAKVEEEIKSI